MQKSNTNLSNMALELLAIQYFLWISLKCLQSHKKVIQYAGRINSCQMYKQWNPDNLNLQREFKMVLSLLPGVPVVHCTES